MKNLAPYIRDRVDYRLAMGFIALWSALVLFTIGGWFFLLPDTGNEFGKTLLPILAIWSAANVVAFVLRIRDARREGRNA